MNPSDVILRPVLSEKAVMAMQNGKYTFFVHPRANRVQVKEAVMAVDGTLTTSAEGGAR